jgi:hypothetical protein
MLDAGDLGKGVFMWLKVGFDSGVGYHDYAAVAAVVGPDEGGNPDLNLGKAITLPPTHG